MMEQRFQTFVTRVRPHRIAVLTNIENPNWQDSCIGIIEFLTKLWGGSQGVIIPTDGKTISEEFWAVLSAHDPDIIIRYQTTYKDLELHEPAAFEKVVGEQLKRHAGADLTAEELRDQVREMVRGDFLDEFNISDDLKRQLLLRLAPFHFDKKNTPGHERQLSIPYFIRGESPAYPLTKVLDILDSSAKPNQVIQIVSDIPAADAPPPLWIAAVMGSNDQQHLAELKAKGVEPYPAPMSNVRESQLINWGIRPRRELKLSTPLSLAMTGLDFYRSIGARRYNIPTVVLVGDSIREFCMYHALLWLQGRALWLPKWFMPTIPGEFPSRLSHAINAVIDIGRVEHNECLVLTSFTEDAAKLEELRTKLGTMSTRSSFSVVPMGADLIAQQVECPSRACTQGNIGDISTVMLVDDRLPGLFNSPIPAKLNPVNPLIHRWLVDITFEKHQLPRHPALGTAVIFGQNVNDVRAAQGCISYSCPGMMVMGDDLGTNMLRPSIHVPNAEAIFRTAFEDCGYTFKLSDKGIYEEAATKRFGGLDDIGYALRVDEFRSLLKAFLDKSKPGSGIHDTGTPLKDGRRYLNFAAVQKILGNIELAERTVDKYVEKGIFIRGFIFRCKRCSDISWFSIKEIDDKFTCRRCSTTQTYTKETWHYPMQPAWFFKLDELVYLMLRDNGDVSLSTLYYLSQQAKGSFLYSPELRITPKDSDKAYLELDICCIPDGKLCIGEAKSTDTLATKDLTADQVATRYCDLAVKMSASTVVFSTSEPKWSIATHNAIDKAFANHTYIEVLRIRRSNLHS